MIVDLDTPSRTAEHNLREWSAAEILDTELSDGLTLRALVRRWEPASGSGASVYSTESEAN